MAARPGRRGVDAGRRRPLAVCRRPGRAVACRGARQAAACDSSRRSPYGPSSACRRPHEQAGGSSAGDGRAIADRGCRLSSARDSPGRRCPAVGPRGGIRRPMLSGVDHRGRARGILALRRVCNVPGWRPMQAFHASSARSAPGAIPSCAAPQVPSRADPADAFAGATRGTRSLAGRPRMGLAAGVDAAGARLTLLRVACAFGPRAPRFASPDLAPGFGGCTTGDSVRAAGCTA